MCSNRTLQEMYLELIPMFQALDGPFGQPVPAVGYVLRVPLLDLFQRAGVVMTETWHRGVGPRNTIRSPALQGRADALFSRHDGSRRFTAGLALVSPFPSRER